MLLSGSRDEIITIQKMFFKYFSNTNYPIHMSTEDQIEYEIADKCWFCYESFSEKDKKVRDHDHLVEKNNYRGAAHSSCNLKAWSIRSAQTPQASSAGHFGGEGLRPGA